jgi:hypothetical protein
MRSGISFTYLTLLSLFFPAFVSPQRLPSKSSTYTKTPFEFRAKDFGKVRIREEKKVNAHDQAVIDKWPIDAPAHKCYDLEAKRPLPALEKGARYFFPAYSFVCIIPTSDPSEGDFAKAYPNFNKAVDQIRDLLKTKPKTFRQFDDMFDFPYNNAGWSVKAKIEYLDFSKVSGVFFLAQYSQDMTPTPLNNEELTAVFQSLTKDGKFYVAARFSATHPSLRRGIDFVDNKPQDNCLQFKYPAINDCVRAYLKVESDRLEKFSDKDFQPSLASIKSLLSSISPQ